MRSIILLSFVLLTGCVSHDPQIDHLKYQIATLQNQVDDINERVDNTHKVAVGANKKAIKATSDVKASKQVAEKAVGNSEEAKTAVKSLIEQLPLPPARPVYTEHE